MGKQNGFTEIWLITPVKVLKYHHTSDKEYWEKVNVSGKLGHFTENTIRLCYLIWHSQLNIRVFTSL